MPKYIVSWTITVEALDDDDAYHIARNELISGNIAGEVEQVEDDADALARANNG